MFSSIQGRLSELEGWEKPSSKLQRLHYRLHIMHYCCWVIWEFASASVSLFTTREPAPKRGYPQWIGNTYITCCRWSTIMFEKPFLYRGTPGFPSWSG